MGHFNEETPEAREYIRDCIIYVFGCIKYFEDNLNLCDGDVTITPKGIAHYDQLVSSGFKPINEDIFQILISDTFVNEDSFHAVFSLIVELRDLGWKKFEDKYHADSGETEEDF